MERIDTNVTTNDPGPGGGRRDRRDDGCWFRRLSFALVLAAAVAAIAAHSAAPVAQEATESE